MAVSKKTARIIAAGLFALTLLFALAPTALAAVFGGRAAKPLRRVQQKLKQWGYYTGAVDGVFGQSTLRRGDSVSEKERPDGGRRRGYGDVKRRWAFPKRRRPRR